MKSILTLLVIAVFASFAFRSHIAAMLMYWWFGIFRPHEWMWWNVDSLRLPLLAASIFIVPLVARGMLPSLKDNLAKLMVTFLVLSIAASISSGCLYPNPVDTNTVFTLIVVSLFSYRLLQNTKHIITLLLLITVSLYFFSAKAGLTSLMQGKSLYDADIGGGGFTGTNAVALGTAMGVFFLLFLIQCFSEEEVSKHFPAIKGRNITRRFIVLFFFVCLIGGLAFVVNTGSRGSGLGLVVSGSLWVLLHPRRLRIGLAIVSLVSALVLVFGLPNEYKERLGSAFVDESELDNSAASRSHFWDVAILMAKEHPLGVGTGCYKSYYDVYDFSSGKYGNARSVHSSHYAILAEIGFVGLVVWIIMILSCFASQWSIRRRSIKAQYCDDAGKFYFYFSNAVLCSLLTFVLGGSFYEMPYNDYLWLIFAFTMASKQLVKTLEKDCINTTALKDQN